MNICTSVAVSSLLTASCFSIFSSAFCFFTSTSWASFRRAWIQGTWKTVGDECLSLQQDKNTGFALHQIATYTKTFFFGVCRRASAFPISKKNFDKLQQDYSEIWVRHYLMREEVWVVGSSRSDHLHSRKHRRLLVHPLWTLWNQRHRAKLVQFIPLHICYKKVKFLVYFKMKKVYKWMPTFTRILPVCWRYQVSAEDWATFQEKEELLTYEHLHEL